MSQVCLSGSISQILEELWRPQPDSPPAKDPTSAYLTILAGLLLALPSLGLSLLWVRSGVRRLQPVARPPKRVYILDGHNVDDAKLTILKDFLGALQPDLDEHKTLQVAVDFLSGQHGDFRGEVREKGAKRRSLYRQTWLKMELPLVGGRRLRLAVCRSSKEKRKRKRRYDNMRLVVVDTIHLKLSPMAADPDLQLKPPPGLTFKGLSATGGVLLRTVDGHYHMAKGHRINDSLERLVNAQRLLAACIFAFRLSFGGPADG